ncbi:hypothetical protein IFM89_035364 [Coptis chinensis]|uniref:Protein FAR1-RELATED SEQUENCE n=1 Tax=Coptis chinensis TaxID=261450 RepID=A0A835IWP8_9MAGN|nr:hypothetical protein IFM89_035364 [Coptis chinensis]
MYTTQQSESINSYFDKYLTKGMTLSKFVKQYELAVLDRWEEENKEDYVTIYARPVLRLNVKIEKEAAEVYTRSIFCKFQEQLYQGLSYRHRKVEEHGTECVYKELRMDIEQQSRYSHDFMLPSFNQEYFGTGTRSFLLSHQPFHLSQVPYNLLT